MADETITTTGVENLNTSVENLNDTIEQGLKDYKKFTKAVVDGNEDVETSLQKIIKQVDRMTKQLRPAIREFDKIDTIVGNAEKGVQSFGKAYAMALVSGNKQAMVATSALTQTSLALMAASRQVKVASDNLGKLSDDFKDATNKIASTRNAISKLEETQKKLNKTIDASEPKNEKERRALLKKKYLLAETEKELVKQHAALDEYSESAEQFAIDSIKAADALKKEQVALLEVNKALIDKAANERQHNRDMRKMAGGATAVTAAFGDVIDTKFFEYFKKAGSLALVAGSFALLMKSLTQVADHAKATSRIAMSLGDASQTGMGRMAQSYDEATEEMSKLHELSIRFNYSMEELTDTMNKVRAGIRMDREGQLTSKAIKSMTEEAALFSRVAGVELGTAVDMMDMRVKRFGMTAMEATANMQDMRIAIHQMTAADKGNTIAMADMVAIIEEASAASQSYIVDTRIMTQALRGAVNQAEHLGVAQKQAKDVAQAVGKILSGAPDFIKIPAGFDLVNQLLGKDADKLLDTLDDGSRKQVIGIQKALRAGKLDYFVGAKALMDLIGQTDAGLEAQSKQLEATILQGPAAAALVAEQYHIENMATAEMVTEMMQNAVEMRTRINETMGAGTISFSTAMVKDTAMLNDAIQNTNMASDEARRELLTTMQKQGLDPEQATEYIRVYQQGLKDTADLEKQIAEAKEKGDTASINNIEKYKQQIYLKTVDRQTMLADKMLRPVKTFMKELREKGPLQRDEITQKIKIDSKAFESMGIKNSEQLAKKIGVNYEKADKKTRAKLDAMLKDGTTPEAIEALHRDSTAAAKAQLAAADAQKNKLASPAERTVGVLEKILASMGVWGPGGLAIAGLAGMGIGIWAIWKGQTKNALLANQLLGNLAGTSVERQTFNALQKDKKTRGQKLIEGGGDEGGGTGEAKKGKWGERAAKAKGYAKRAGGHVMRNKGKYAIAAAALAFGGYKLFSKGEEKKEEDEDIAKKAKELGEPAAPAAAPAAAAAGGGLLGMMGMTPPAGGAPGGAMGLAGEAAKMALPSLGIKAAKAGLKMAGFVKAIPLVGNVVAAGFAIKQAWELYDKWKKDPNSITTSDKVKMATSLAGMIPGIGNAIMMADTVADITGGYDLLDDVTKQKDEAAQETASSLSLSEPPSSLKIAQLAESRAGAIPGRSAGMPEAAAPLSASTRRTGLAYNEGGGGKSTLYGSVGSHSVTPAGDILIKVQGWQDLTTKMMKDAKALTA